MYSSNTSLGGEFLAMGLGMLILMLALIVGVTLLVIFYYKTFIDAMAHVRPSNRETGVGNILFMWIPLFNLVYGFIVYPKIVESIRKEYQSLGIMEEGDFGRGLAITMCALQFGFIIPFINFLTPIAMLVIWIIFWVKINGYKETLMTRNSNGFAESKGVNLSSSSDLLD